MPDDLSPRVAVLILTLMGLGSCALGAAVYQWWKRGTLLDYEPRRPVPWNGWDVGGVFLFWLISMIAASAAPFFIARMSPVADLPLLSLISQCVASMVIVLFVAAVLSVRGATLRDLGLRLDKAGDDLFIGVGAFFVVLVPVYGLMIVLGLLFPEAAKHPLVELLKERPELVLPCAVVAVIVAPITEEFLFRAVFQGWLEKRASLSSWSVARRIDAPAPSSRQPEMSHSTLAVSTKEESGHPYEHFPLHVDGPQAQSPLETTSTTASQPVLFRPLVVSSFCFAAVHFPHGVAPIPLFFFALALGYLYQRTHRLLAPVVLHMCLNACSMLFLWLETRAG